MKKISQKYLCFRFDIDTHICLKSGVPKLLEVFEYHNCHCTFFVSMGRAFKRSYFISEKISNTISPKFSTPNENFSMFYKLGALNSLKIFFLNPLIGGNYHRMLKKVIATGNELGLHGGRNHATWEFDSYKWTEEQLRDEIQYGLNQFEIQKLPKPMSFASPCWKSPEILNKLLEELDFTIVANQHATYNYLNPVENTISKFPTNVIGQNREIGFIENFRALGYSTDQILFEFSNQLDAEGNFKMVFDHPFYVGKFEISTIAAMIKIAKSKGYTIESLKNIHINLQNENITYLS